MKRLIFAMCMILCLLLCACSKTAPTTESLVEEIATEGTSEDISEESIPPYDYATLQENSAFMPFSYNTDGLCLGIIVNEPFEQTLQPTITWREGEYDRAYIIPRYVGSRVDIYEMLWDVEGNFTYSSEPVYSTLAEDGCIIYGAFERPEGMPMWHVEIINPPGTSGGMTLSYNGNTGTPAIEKIEVSNGWIIGEDVDVTYAKPVIYLYPKEETEVTVKLDCQGSLTCTYPAYQNGWAVTAQPDGTLTDASGQTYNYLYWEGKSASDFDFSEGFCVAGKDTAAFLEAALRELGLNRREANEFIVYWLPLMQENPYNIISFQTDAYTEAALLSISPAPDTVIRVFMAWYASDELLEITPQELTAPERTGFTVIEWGGSQVK